MPSPQCCVSPPSAARTRRVAVRLPMRTARPSPGRTVSPPLQRPEPVRVRQSQTRALPPPPHRLRRHRRIAFHSPASRNSPHRRSSSRPLQRQPPLHPRPMPRAQRSRQPMHPPEAASHFPASRTSRPALRPRRVRWAMLAARAAGRPVRHPLRTKIRSVTRTPACFRETMIQRPRLQPSVVGRSVVSLAQSRRRRISAKLKICRLARSTWMAKTIGGRICAPRTP